MNYDKLVKALRCCTQNSPETCVGCAYNIGNNECAVRRMALDAAAAIEDMANHITEMHERVTVLQIARGELEAEVKRLKESNEELQQIADHYEQTAKDYWKEACEYHAIVSAKDITAKESEELIRKFKKLPCGPIEPNEPKRGEWIWIQKENGGQYKGCSVCHAPIPTDSMLDYLDDEDCDFCYSCGAKMEVQDDKA